MDEKKDTSSNLNIKKAKYDAILDNVSIFLAGATEMASTIHPVDDHTSNIIDTEPNDTNEFYSERHRTKQHLLAYITLGAGPRNCIDIRFVIIQKKIALVHLLKACDIVKMDELDHVERYFLVFIK
ncbi:hypothetical protein I4U23_004753 [Adineta vaga]|nr:hypothetical protein I4U23_004753 [Adineta vaga]